MQNRFNNFKNIIMKKYTIEQYIKDTSRTCASLGSDVADNTHMLLGIVTESGELCDTFKKNFAYGKEIDWVNVKEEVGDLLWYIANFCRINNISITEVMKTNVNKLKLRYPEKFTEENAINRDTKKEREELEKDDVIEITLNKQEDPQLGFMLVAKETWDDNINSENWKHINELEAQVYKETTLVYFRTIQVSETLSENIYAVLSSQYRD